MDISVSHGPHNMMNLVEGNIAGGMGSDGYFGSTSHITIAELVHRHASHRQGEPDCAERGQVEQLLQRRRQHPRHQ